MPGCYKLEPRRPFRVTSDEVDDSHYWKGAPLMKVPGYSTGSKKKEPKRFQLAFFYACVVELSFSPRRCIAFHKEVLGEGDDYGIVSFFIVDLESDTTYDILQQMLRKSLIGNTKGH